LSGESTVPTAWASSSCCLLTTYAYNAFGLRTRMTYPDEGAGRQVRDLTAVYHNGVQTSLMDTLAGGAIHTNNIQYNPAGGLTGLTFPGHSSDEITPDVRNRPQRIRVTGPLPEEEGLGTVFDSGLYTYDGAGNISKIGVRSYTYDAANRLVNAYETDNDNTVGYTLSWQYDAFGNMLQSTRAVGAAPVSVRSFTVAGNNQLQTMTEEQTSSTFLYDERGNIVDD